jgi:hypothetical protein
VRLKTPQASIILCLVIVLYYITSFSLLELHYLFKRSNGRARVNQHPRLANEGRYNKTLIEVGLKRCALAFLSF